MLRDLYLYHSSITIKNRGKIFNENTQVRAAQGIAFSIPSNMAKWVVTQLINLGKVKRSYLGIVGFKRPLDRRIVRFYKLAKEEGVEISSIERQGPSQKAGLRTGDIVVRLGERSIASIDDIYLLLRLEKVVIPDEAR